MKQWLDYLGDSMEIKRFVDKIYFNKNFMS